MNIFHTTECPIESARSQHDRHVVKMILESAQMLSTAIHATPKYLQAYDSCNLPNKPQLYKVNHLNHPSTIWVRESDANFIWLTIHLHALIQEYHKRFVCRTHKCESMFWLFAELCAKVARLPNSRESKAHRTAGFLTAANQVNPQFYDYAMTHHTPFVFCGPDGYRNQPVIDSYREYYLDTKVINNRWTNHPTLSLPDWLAPTALIYNRPTRLTTKMQRVRAPRITKSMPIRNRHGIITSGVKFGVRVSNTV